MVLPGPVPPPPSERGPQAMLSFLCCPVYGLCQERGAFSLAGKEETRREICAERPCVCCARSACLPPVAHEGEKKKKKKDFYLSGKKARKLKARGRVSCSARCCFASILARVWQALLLSVVKNQRRKKGALIPRGAYKAPFLLLLNLHSWTQLLAPLLLEQLNY